MASTGSKPLAGCNDIGARSYGSIASILQHGLDRAYPQEKVPDGAPIRHANIRGQRYYH